MRRTRLIEALRMIRHTGAFFLTIVLVTGLVLSAYTGIDYATASIEDHCAAFFNENRLFDLKLGSAYGFTEEKMDAIRAVSDIDCAESIYSVQALITIRGEGYAAEFYTMPETINRVLLRQGRYPQGAGECVAEEALLERFGLQLGDTIVTQSDALKEQSFTIVGAADLVTVFAENNYNNRGTTALADGQITTEIMVSEAAFSESSVKQVCYATIRNRPPRSSGEYEERVRALKKTLLTTLAELEQKDYDAVYARYSTAFAAAMERYSQGDGSAEAELLALKEEAEGLRAPKVYAGGVASNPSYVYVSEITRATDSIVAALCTLLIAIALLVNYTVIGRLVTEQHRLIGAQKALGFRTREIFSGYLLYSVLGTVAGGAFGLLGSYYFVQQKVFDYVYGRAFITKDFAPLMKWRPALLVLALELALMICSAALACRRMLRCSAIELMGSGIQEERPPKREKRQLPLLRAMTRRNLRRNPQILVTTLVCVMSCTVILIAVLHVRHGISWAAPNQFDTLQNYDSVLTLDSTASVEEQEALRTLIESDGAVDSLNVMEQYVSYRVDVGTKYAALLCYERTEQSDSFLCLQDCLSRQTLSPPEDGILICRKIAENFGLRPGDTLTVTDEMGGEYPAQIVGIFERSVGMAMVTSPTYYRALTGTEPVLGRYYLRGDEASIASLVRRAKESAAYCSCEDAGYFEAEMAQKVSSAGKVVLLLLGASAALSLFVLFNLAQMNIRKKEKEIVVMKVLGFPTRRICACVFCEAMAMCALGLVLGLFLGGPVGAYVTTCAELENLQYYRGVDLPSVLLGGGINALFFTAANLLALAGIRRIPMTGTAREA